MKLNKVNQSLLTLHDASQEEVFTITHDGKLIVNPKYTTEDAARVFFTELGRLIRAHNTKDPLPPPWNN